MSASSQVMAPLAGRDDRHRRRLKVTGTLTVLFLAAQGGLLEDFPATLLQLQQTGFRASPELIQCFLGRYSKLRRSEG